MTQVLHWATAALIIGQFVLAKLAERAEEAGSQLTQLGLLANHKSLGMSILILAIVRLSWRSFNPPPLPPDKSPNWQNNLAKLMHWVLYILIFAIPLTGWLMSSASAYSVSWFNLFSFPDLITPDEDVKEQFHEIHHLLAETLFVLACLHILAALKHHFMDKDNVLKGILSITSFAVFLAILGSVLFALTSVSSPAKVTEPVPQAVIVESSAAVNAALVTPVVSELPLWNINYAESVLSFSAVQAGASFTGIWESWNADVHFDPQQLALSSAEVTITIASINSQDSDRDITLMDADWFDEPRYPIARFRADDFSANTDGSYTAHGTLTTKSLDSKVDLIFTVAGEVLAGEAKLDRLDLQIGTGEWLDTTWVGADVQVLVKLVREL